MDNRRDIMPYEVLYPQRTKRLRLLELLLCVICLILASVIWSTPFGLNRAVAILFATSFAFSIITLIDVFAGVRNRQYTALVWIGLAFPAAFMFFLSFGFLVVVSQTTLIIISVVCFITAVVFLLDGILIIMQLAKNCVQYRVHPIPKDENCQVCPRSFEESFCQEEIETSSQTEIRTTPRTKETCPGVRREPISRSSLPRTTTYGGTFPVGKCSCATPLPTPDALFEMDKKYPQEVKYTFKASCDCDTPPDSQDVQEEIYPLLLETQSRRKESSVTVGSNRPQTYSVCNTNGSVNMQNEVRSNQEEMRRQQVQGSKGRQEQPSGYCRQPMPRSHQTSSEGDSCRGSGVRKLENADSTRGQDKLPRSVQTEACQCCCAGNYASEQGAVRQYPQASIEEQQMMILDQLEMMRQSCRPHVCSCHEKPTREPRSQASHIDRASPMAVIVESKESSSGVCSSENRARENVGPGKQGSIKSCADSRSARETVERTPRSTTDDASTGRSHASRRKTRISDLHSGSDTSTSFCENNNRRVSLGTLDIRILPPDPCWAYNWAKKPCICDEKNATRASQGERKLRRPSVESITKSIQSNASLKPYKSELFVDLELNQKKYSLETGSNPTLFKLSEEIKSRDQLSTTSKQRNKSTGSGNDNESIKSIIEIDNESILSASVKGYNISGEDVFIDNPDNNSVKSRSEKNDSKLEPFKKDTVSYNFKSEDQKDQAIEQNKATSEDLNVTFSQTVDPSESVISLKTSEATSLPDIVSEKSLPQEPPTVYEDRRPTVESQIHSILRQPSTLEKSDVGGVRKGSKTDHVVLPRMLHPIEEMRMKQGITVSPSEDRKSHLSFCETVPRDMMMVKEVSCKCVCKRVFANAATGANANQPIRRRSHSLSPNCRKYYAPPLNEQPYHPKDDFRLPTRTFETHQTVQRNEIKWIKCPRKNEKVCATLNCFPERRNNLDETARSKSGSSKSPRTPNRCVDKSVGRNLRTKTSLECLPQCPTCPKRAERLRRDIAKEEAPLFQENSSSSKRRPVKRVFPERKE